MFKKKDVIRTLFLLLVILVIVVTLSQILVVHKRNHHKTQPRDSTRLQTAQAMVIRLEKNMEAMMKKNFLPTGKHRNYLLASIYSQRIRQKLTELSHRTHGTMKHERLSEDSFAAFRERKLRFHDIADNDIVTHEAHSRHKLQQFIEDSANKLSDAVKLPCDDKNSTDHGIIKTSGIKQTQRAAGTNILTNGGRFISGNQQSFNVLQCQESPDSLGGTLRVTQTIAQNDNMLDEAFSDIKHGGTWKPTTCMARHRTAIILPFRNREHHLRILLYNLIPVLKRQLIEFKIFVVEQHGNMTFNKGRLMNAGFMEAWTLWNFDCVIFHDVDLLPENDRNMYTCGVNPRHMSIAVDKFKYRLPYFTLVGGVFSIKREHFLKVNGYSNLYWGWGAEDDDMAYRLKTVKLGIERPPATIGRYQMIKHENRETIPVKMRAYLLKTVRKRYHRDGLNTLNYKVISINSTLLYTHITVDVGEPPREAADINNLLT